ncbi:MAG TPA: hypothetical protein DEO89_09110 [Lachnospiraceae bacterium]|nr:hypothetical protein [Lachnospiraceae bacterium]
MPCFFMKGDMTMKKLLCVLCSLLCFPYFSMFVWSTQDTVSSNTAQSLTTQETASTSNVAVPYYLEKIGAADTAATLGGYPMKETVVAIIDTGAELAHEDLADSLWTNEAELNGEDNVDDDGNGFIDDIYGIDLINDVPTPNPKDPSAPLRYGAPEDDATGSHGTHVSGIVGMNPNNTVGSSGVGYRAKIMIVKAGNRKEGFSFANAAKAVQYAVANGADVLNLSFGSYIQNDTFAAELLEASKSCVVVAAAGNDGKAASDSVLYPAGYPYIIGVMASDPQDEICSFSNYADCLPAPYDIICPGESIYSTSRYNSYEIKSGTSMAAPMVSGSAAVIMGFLEANKTYDSREALLTDTKKYLYMSDSVYTYTTESGLLIITPRLNLKNSLLHIIEDLNLDADAETSDVTASAAPTGTPATTPAAPSPELSSTPEPSGVPDSTPDTTPVVSPTGAPVSPSEDPVSPSTAPTLRPTQKPTAVPTTAPVTTPAAAPTKKPTTPIPATAVPTKNPATPSGAPTLRPTQKPTAVPTKKPATPSPIPATAVPTKTPVTPAPTKKPATPIPATPAPTKKPAASSPLPTAAVPTKKPPALSPIPTASAPAKTHTPASAEPAAAPVSTPAPKTSETFNTKTLRIKISRIKKKKKNYVTINWKKVKIASCYQIRIKNKKKNETRWLYTKKTKITLKKTKYIRISIRAQKKIGKKTWSGPYKKI